MIAELITCDVHRIEAVDPVPGQLRRHCAAQRHRAGNRCSSGDREPLASITAYETVLLGSPIWNVRAPMIMTSFTESHDFTAKTVLPFVTFASAASAASNATTRLPALAPGLPVVWLSAAKRSLSTVLMSKPGSGRTVKNDFSAP
jgi:hypothetical protein